MAFPDEPEGADTPPSEGAPESTSHESLSEETAQHGEPSSVNGPETPHPDGSYPEHVSYEPLTEQSYPYYDETYSYKDEWSSSGQPGNPLTLTPTPAAPPSFSTPTEEVPAPVTSAEPVSETKSPAAPLGAAPGGSQKPPKPPEPPAEGDEDEGMARMSFLEHLEELRKRLLLALGGVGIAFALSLLFSNQLWNVVVAPAVDALTRLHVNPPSLRLISPMDTFQII